VPQDFCIYAKAKSGDGKQLLFKTLKTEYFFK